MLYIGVQDRSKYQPALKADCMKKIKLLFEIFAATAYRGLCMHSDWTLHLKTQLRLQMKHLSSRGCCFGRALPAPA